MNRSIIYYLLEQEENIENKPKPVLSTKDKIKKHLRKNWRNYALGLGLAGNAASTAALWKMALSNKPKPNQT